MKARLGASLLLLASCTWSNSLYQAGALSAEAMRSDRDGRPVEAEGYWSQAAVKAESAYVRAPTGKHAAKAEWLLGRALAHTRDCDRALTYLAASRAAAPQADWHEPLDLELARCTEVSDTAAAARIFLTLVGSKDAAIRQAAREAAGRDLAVLGEPARALQLLEGSSSSTARLDRAVALALLARPDSALAEIEPLLRAADTTLAWNRLTVALASQPGRAADSLLTMLGNIPGVSPRTRAGWWLAALRATPVSEEADFQRRLAALVALPPSPEASRGRVLAAERVVAAVPSLARLVALRDSFAKLPEPRDDLIADGRWKRLTFLVGRVAGEASAVTPTTPAGDLVLFADGELARDSLGAPPLAAELFGRVEQERPESPYLAKAILARIPLDPDSAAALRERVRRLASSPYLAYMRGETDPRFAPLEDSLATFIRQLESKARAAVAQVIQ